jgi:hypothetical protein
MLQIAMIVAALILIVWAPIENRKVRSGWINPRFKGKPEDYRRAYTKQIKVGLYLALFCAVLNTGMAFIEPKDGANLAVQLGIGVMWAVAAIVMFYCLNSLKAMPALPPQA